MQHVTNKKNYFYSLVSSFGGTTISTLIGVITLPISLNYWQIERYGLWSLLTSMLVYLGISNLGLNSAATVLMGKEINNHTKLNIFKKTLIILAISAAVSLIFFILLNIFYSNWIRVLGVIPSTLKVEATSTCLVMGLFFFINLPFSLNTSVLQGFQRAYIDNIFPPLNTILGLACLLFVIHVKGSLITFAYINGISTLLFNIIKTAVTYIYIKHHLFTHKKSIENSENSAVSYLSISSTGMRFFILSLASLVVWNTDYLVISNFLGVAKVTPYAVTFRVYQILFSCIILLNGAVFPIMAKEFGQGSWTWISEQYNYFIIILAIIGGLTWIGGVLFMKDIVYLWTGSKGYAGLLTTISLGGYSYLLCMVSFNDGLIKTFNYTKKVSLIYWMEAAVKITFSLFLVKFFDIAGVALGTFFGSLFSVSIFLPIWLNKKSSARLKMDIKFIAMHFLTALSPILILGILMQQYINSIYMRIIIGIILIAGYTLLTLLITPKSVLLYSTNMMKDFPIIKRMGFRKNEFWEKKNTGK